MRVVDLIEKKREKEEERIADKLPLQKQGAAVVFSGFFRKNKV